MSMRDYFNFDINLEDTGFGIAFGILFIILNILAPVISIGVPFAVQLQDAKSIVSIGVAPIAEELVFRGAMDSILAGFLGLFAPLVTAGVFSGFHYVAYGTAQGASFVGAFVFGLLASLLVLWRKNIWAVIVGHAVFNGFLIASGLVILPVLHIVF